MEDIAACHVIKIQHSTCFHGHVTAGNSTGHSIAVYSGYVDNAASPPDCRNCMSASTASRVMAQEEASDDPVIDTAHSPPPPRFHHTTEVPSCLADVGCLWCPALMDFEA